MNRSSFQNYWGRLRQFQVPYAVVRDGTLAVKADALSILLVLLESASARKMRPSELFVQVKISYKLLIERSGFTKNTVTKALKQLEGKFVIKCGDQRRKRGEFGVNEYFICDPLSGEPLEVSGKNFYRSHNIRYLNIPRCIVKDFPANWSLAQISPSEIRLYVSICSIANSSRSGQFETTSPALMKLSGLARRTFVKALECLQDRHLIWCPMTHENEISITLCDPYTGEPLHAETGQPEDDPANYYVKGEQGRERRVNFDGVGAEQVKLLVQSCLTENDVVKEQGSGDFSICCPFHNDTNPSCYVNPIKRCFHCFGCKHSGTLTQLIMQLRKCSKAQAIEKILAATETVAHYRDPDSRAEAIYSYRDQRGKVMKQKLRYPGKKFRWRRPGGGGSWIWNVEGLQPVLYNLDRLEFAQTVCVCEGEKDCDTIMNLSLRDGCGSEIVATTSGGSGTWDDRMAEALIGKQVILMPDADESGRRYQAEIEASLRARGIQYRVVTFEEQHSKDVSEFIASGHSASDLYVLIGMDWTVFGESELTNEFTPA
jgi:5S rRNA maturation endonuclease (ribonuclease M5)